MRKKFLQGVTSLGVATAICLACGIVTASANTIKPENITIDYDSQKIIVKVNGSAATTPTDPTDSTDPTDPSEAEEENVNLLADDGSVADNEILFGISALKSGKYTTASWEVHETKGKEEVAIDISGLNTQKDNYMQIKGDNSSDPITIKIPASDKTAKMKFNANTGLVEYNKGKDKEASLEYRTQYGDWADYGTYSEGTELKMYQQKGTTLYFRLQTTDKEVLSNYDGGEDDVYTVDSLPGKEIKVSVGKMANGPKATVDYLKHTIKIPKNVVYRTNTATTLGDFTETATSKAETLDSAKIDELGLFNGSTLELYTVGDANKKKADSKITRVEFKQQEETDVDVKYDYKSDKKTLTVENKSTDTYEVVVNASTEPMVGAKTTKAKAVKAGKTVTIKNVDGLDKVWIHVVGDKKNGVWSTNYIPLDDGSATTPTTPTDPTQPTDPAGPTDQELLASLADELFVKSVDLDGTASKGDDIVIVNSGKTVTWDASADYTLDNGTAVEGVTITIAVENNPDEVVKLTGTSLTYGMKGTAIETESADVIVTLSKDGCTDEVLTIHCALPTA